MDNNIAIKTPRRRWDPVVRLTHWSIVAAIIVNALVTEEGSATHVWVGYALAATLALRLIWGVIGPREARFTSFFPSPRRTLAHIRDIAAGRPSEHRSHNPLGACMVYAIWSVLIVIIASGIAMSGLPSTTGAPGGERGEAVAAYAPTGATSREDGEEAEREGEGEGDESILTEVHEVSVNLLYLLILLHIAGVVFETRRSGRQIVMAMLPGRR